MRVLSKDDGDLPHVIATCAPTQPPWHRLSALYLANRATPPPQAARTRHAVPTCTTAVDAASARDYVETPPARHPQKKRSNAASYPVLPQASLPPYPIQRDRSVSTWTCQEPPLLLSSIKAHRRSPPLSSGHLTPPPPFFPSIPPSPPC